MYSTAPCSSVRHGSAKSSVLIVLLCLSGVSIVALSTVSSAHAEALGSWTTTSTPPSSGGNVGGSISCSPYSGFVYCVGSDGSTENAYFAPISSSGIGTWSFTTEYPTSSGNGGVESISCGIASGYIYCVGGQTQGSGGKPVNATYFAPVSSSGIGAWTSTTKYPVPVSGESCVIVAGYIYCVGGLDNYAYFAPISSSGIGTWSSTSDYPLDVVTQQTCASSGQYIYCVGGETGPQGLNATDGVYYASLSSSGIGSWYNSTSYPSAEYGMGCAVSGAAYLYCVAGVNQNYVYTTAVNYAPVSSSGVGAWTSTISYPNSGVANSPCVISGSYIYCISTSTSASPAHYAYISSSPTSSVTITSENSDGSTLTGFRTVLYASNGSIIAKGFTPNTFTVAVGQTYGVRAESYGSCNFVQWSDGVTSDPRTYTATSSAATFTAIYNCGASSVSVDSVNQDGSTITGFRTVLYASNGTILDKGFTPSTFTTTLGDSYGIRAESYGSCTFAEWSDGVTSDPRTFTASSSAAVFTAVYTCGTSSVAVNSVNQDGVSITGYYAVLYNSSGSVISTGFTPTTYTTTIGNTYELRADSYGSCTFSHWSDGVTSDPMTFTSTSSSTTYTAVYDCST